MDRQANQWYHFQPCSEVYIAQSKNMQIWITIQRYMGPFLHTQAHTWAQPIDLHHYDYYIAMMCPYAWSQMHTANTFTTH